MSIRAGGSATGGEGYWPDSRCSCLLDVGTIATLVKKIKGPGASEGPGPLLKPKSATPLPDRGGLA